MIIEAQWSCEWCGKVEKISSFTALFRWLLPRYCQPVKKIAGWPHPSCVMAVKFANKIAEQRATEARENFLESVRGQNLGTLRVKFKKGYK